MSEACRDENCDSRVEFCDGQAVGVAVLVGECNDVHAPVGAEPRLHSVSRACLLGAAVGASSKMLMCSCGGELNGCGLHSLADVATAA